MKASVSNFNDQAMTKIGWEIFGIIKKNSLSNLVAKVLIMLAQTKRFIQTTIKKQTK